MKILSLVAVAGLLFGAVSKAFAAEDAGTRVPVLLELFTSEGCSSCPSADKLLERLERQQPAADAELIVLSEHVDYWNRLGWEDPFSSALYSARQQDYARKLHTDDVYTPQLVVDGRFGFVGSDERQALAAINKSARPPKVPIKISNLEQKGKELTARVEVLADRRVTSGKVMLYAAIADNHAESHVARGENSGRVLAHVAVTRVLQNLTGINPHNGFSEAITLPFSQGAGGSRIVVFLQDSNSGHVLGAAMQPISKSENVQVSARTHRF